jgi:selenoprotein W-related protein
MTLVPASGGCFELSVNGDLIYSKLKNGQFPDEQAIVKEIGARLKK